MSLENLTTIGCDGTVTNTGAKGGMISLLENVQYNELPMRHLYQFPNAKTTGPRTYADEIGKKLDKSEKIDIQHSKVTYLEVRQDLRTDQKY